MADLYVPCAHCGQWISPRFTHYVLVKDRNGEYQHLHFRPCLDQYDFDHVVEEKDPRVYTHVPRLED